MCRGTLFVPHEPASKDINDVIVHPVGMGAIQRLIGIKENLGVADVAHGVRRIQTHIKRSVAAHIATSFPGFLEHDVGAKRGLWLDGGGARLYVPVGKDQGTVPPHRTAVKDDVVELFKKRSLVSPSKTPSRPFGDTSRCDGSS